MKLIIICVVIVSILYTVVNGQLPSTLTSTKLECKANGEYCQYHSQCCSNSCLSYSYRCVASHQNLQTIYDKSPPYVVINEQANSNVISGINAIDELVDRFGNDEFITDQVPTVRPVLTMSPTTPTTITSTPKVHSIVCSNEGQRCFTTDDCCSNNNTCSEASVCVYNSRHEMLNEKCLTNGNKCFRHEECCSSRCHQFLHQCVT